MRHDAAMALDQTIMRLESLLFEPHGDDSGYDLHSLPMPEFLAGMGVCGSPGKFIDIGCGIGTKLVVAHHLGWQVAGVERHADYAAVAKKLIPEADIQVADALSLTDLSDYDVVYSFRLMFDLDEQQELNDKIMAIMRPGALYFCAGSDPKGVKEIGHGVWEVG